MRYYSMPLVEKIGFGLWVREVFRASHFLPCVTVAAITGLLAYGSGQRASALLAFGAVLFGQFSVGWCNDFLDRKRDRAAGRLEKPIVSGHVRATTIMRLSIMALVLSLLLSFVYGSGAGIVHIVALISAYLYNFRLKNSPLSIVTFIVSFGLLPVFVGQGAVTPYVPTAWMIIATALLGAGIHFQNVIPDLLHDAKTGIKGLPHYFSYNHSLLLSGVFMALSASSIGLGTLGDVMVNLATIALVLFAFVTLMFFILYLKKDITRAFKVSAVMSFLCILVVISGASLMRG